jgi:hypothetical protein
MLTLERERGSCRIIVSAIDDDAAINHSVIDNALTFRATLVIGGGVRLTLSRAIESL